MSPTRIAYGQLPAAVRDRISQIVGMVTAADPAAEGLNSAVAARLHTSGGRYFVKALPVEHRWAWAQQREAEIAPYVDTVGARLIARIVEAGWDVLIFEALHGHQADYSPDSNDLEHVTQLLTRIGNLPCPDTPLRHAEQRLAAYTSDDMLPYFTGDRLLHTDLNPANIIVNDHEARIVDWGWATRGAAWLDAAYWVSWLITAGHTPQQAEWWAAQTPAWQTATTAGVTAFAEANARMWADIGAGSTDAWTTRILAASTAWSQYRRASA
ncbi:phosphotransferase [Actinoplanes flavus]|uniref:Phosphotransferase n=1 Tax=Actinoplanes flavus TaxID=2820290 RepID=A0ABS3UZL8_9ACTN|nr:phosphotransferase [Actinoplanes flavus]MBO3744018.1 phosphotransferase [Actinoplanes flavus]